MNSRHLPLLPLLVIIAGPTARSAIITSTFTGTTSQSYNIGTNWSPTGVPNNGANQFQIVISPAVALPVLMDVSATVNTLNLGAGSTLSLQNAIGLTAAGDFTNNGLILLNGTSLNTRFQINDPVDQAITLGGTGILRLTDPNENIGGTLNHVLTNGASHTIEGVGNLGNISINLVNLGTFRANVTGQTLAVRPLATFLNSGLVKSQNGGSVAVNSGTVTQSGGGRFEVADGSRFDFQTCTLDGVSLSVDDQDNDLSNNLYSLSDFGTVFKNVTLTGTLTNNANRLTLTGDLINNGIVRTVGATITSSIYINDTADQQVLLGGTGRVVMDNPLQIISGDINQVLTQGHSHTIEGTGKIGNNSIDLVNQGTIRANVSGKTLTINPRNTFLNAGLVRAENGGIGAITTGTVTQGTGGHFEVADGSRFDFQTCTIDGVTLGVNDQDSDLSNNLYSLSSSGTIFKNVTLNGTLTNNANRLTLTGDLINNGIVRTVGATVTSSIYINDPSDQQVLLGGTGRLVMNDPLQLISGDLNHVLTQGASHTIEGTGNLGNVGINIINKGTILANAATPLRFYHRTFLTNKGTVRVEPGSTLTVSRQGFTNEGIIDVRPGGSVEFDAGIDFSQSSGELGVNGSFQTDDLIVTGGSVTGAGTIYGSPIQIVGTVKPGNPVGTLKLLGTSATINGPVEIELQSDSVHDRIEFNYDATGTITLALKTVGPASGFSGAPIEFLSHIQNGIAANHIVISNVANGARLLTTDGRASFIVNGTDHSSEYTLTSPLFAPEFTAEPYAFDVDESAPFGTTVGTITAIDPEGSGVTYSVVGSTPFAINAATGAITIDGPLDFSSQPIYTVQVGASDGSMTAITPVIISINPLPGSNEAIVNDLLTGVGGAFPGQTDPAVVGFNADPDGDAIANVFELWLGTDPAVADGPADLVVFPLTVGPNTFAALDVTVVKAVDDVLVVNGQLTHGLQSFRNGTRSQLSETATTRRLRFLDSVPIADARAFGRLAAVPDAVK